MESKKRPHSPDPTILPSSAHPYGQDTPFSLPPLSQAPTQERVNLPPVSSLTKRQRLENDMSGGADPSGHAHTQAVGGTGSGDTRGSNPKADFTGIAALAQLAGAASALQQLPPISAALGSASGQSLPSIRSFTPPVQPARFEPTASKFGTPGAPSYALPNAPPATHNVGVPYPSINISSPVSKVPKPPAAYGNKESERAYSPGKKVAPTSPNLSPVLNPTIATIPPPAASFLQAVNVGPYGANPFYSAAAYYAQSAKPHESGATPQDAAKHTPGAEMTARKGSISTHQQQPFSSIPLSPPNDDDEDDGIHRAAGGEDETDDAMVGRKRKKSAHVDPMEEERARRREKMEKRKEELKKTLKPGEVGVINDDRLLLIPKGVEERFLGHVVYTGARMPHSNRVADTELFLLPAFTIEHHYSTIEVRIPAEQLTMKGNLGVKRNAVWGTDVYTDDSDVVAMIIHCGAYKPIDAPPPKVKAGGD
ncbi:hypothetical protein HK104_005182, partial [Borealophlyctis nickersoniae]